MAVIVLLVVANTAGRLVTDRIPLDAVERYTLRFLCGLCFCAVALVVVGSYSVVWTVALMFALAAAAVLGEWHHFRENPAERAPADPPIIWTAFPIACAVAIGGANLLGLVNALAPNTSWDAGAAHLALPAAYARIGHMTLIDGNAYSAYPHLLHTLYTYCYTLGGETAASLINWVFGVLAVGALYSLGKRVYNAQAGLTAAAMLATAPIFFDQSGTVGIDLPFLGAAMGAFACCYVAFDTKDVRWAVLAGILAGASCGMRHTGFLVCAFLAVGLIAWSKGRYWRQTAAFCSAALFAMLPWLIRTAVVSGNPLYPFFPSLFPTDALPDIQTTAFGMHDTLLAQGTGIVAFLRFPWDIVMRPFWYDGWTKSPGPWPLVLGVVGLVVGGARVWGLGAFSIAGGIIIFYFQRLARYALPFFAPMMVAGAVASERLKPLRPWIHAALALSFVYGLALGLATVHFKVPAALGIETREDYLTRRVERYPAFLWVNENLPPDERILTLDPRTYYISGDTYHNLAALENLAEESFESQLAWLHDQRIRYVLFQQLYLGGGESRQQKAITSVIRGWRGDTEHFRRVESMTLPNVRTRSPEIVQIYEVLPEGASDAGP